MAGEHRFSGGWNRDGVFARHAALFSRQSERHVVCSLYQLVHDKHPHVFVDHPELGDGLGVYSHHRQNHDATVFVRFELSLQPLSLFAISLAPPLPVGHPTLGYSDIW